MSSPANQPPKSYPLPRLYPRLGGASITTLDLVYPQHQRAVSVRHEVHSLVRRVRLLAPQERRQLCTNITPSRTKSISAQLSAAIVATSPATFAGAGEVLRARPEAEGLHVAAAVHSQYPGCRHVHDRAVGQLLQLGRDLLRVAGRAVLREGGELHGGGRRHSRQRRQRNAAVLLPDVRGYRREGRPSRGSVSVGSDAVKRDYDSDETYCRVTAQNSLEASLDANVLLASSSSSEVELDVEAVNVVQAQQPVDIAWTATLTRNASKDIQLPTPLKAVFVLDDDSTNESGYYTIVSSVVKLCERSKACTEYSGAVDVSSADFSANFSSAGTATFNASGIIIPSTGWYSGFAQVTLAGNDADSQRYDFIKYFEMFATEENVAEQVETETYANDGSESYCWVVVAAAEDENVDATSVAYSGNGTNCPYTVNMTVSTTTFTVDAGALVSWTVAKQPAFTGTDGVVVNMTTVYDDSTGQYVNLPQVNIYYCDDTRCSPFSENKTLAYSAAAMNFSDRSGEALFSTKISIGNEGTYALMAHVVVPNGDDLRFDVASFMRMTVTASSKSASTDDSSSSHVGLILGLTLGCAAVVSLAVFGFAVMRRRRVQQEAEQQKERRYSFFGFRPLSNTNELPTNSPSGHGSDESGNFMYMKAQPSPPMDMRPRSSSLSYDPYARRSFLEAGDDASGYSFSLSDAEAPFPPSSPNERTTSTQLTLATHPF
ncbi:hypothetical protein ON010_g9652 [Phytophthora cinnamomi]|nr:hypothetical protein ON010_g9652 [Phytophthora cinnamomi]